jgi:hypothetical protein
VRAQLKIRHTTRRHDDDAIHGSGQGEQGLGGGRPSKQRAVCRDGKVQRRDGAGGARIKFSGEKRTVTDGPFTETKELVAGFWLLAVKSKEEAIEWIKRAPFDNGEEVEIRQVFEAEDFGPELAPELREQEARLRAQAASKP